tara:strand:- start:790 stop:1539 length:750 start_codon:yes stop_codon:yes gene_type:complete
MKIGLVPMSAKPYHIGHHKLIDIAAKENDVTFVFVSFSSRGVKKIKDPTDKRTIKQGARKIEVPKDGELPIFGSDMRYIWLNILKEELEFSGRVELVFPKEGKSLIPVLSVHEACASLIESIDNNAWFEIDGQKFESSSSTIQIYSDKQDIATNYDNQTMTKYYKDDWFRHITLVGVDRNDTVNISGTKMRALLSERKNIDEFKSLLPPIRNNSKNIVAEILFDSAGSGTTFNSRCVRAIQTPLPIYAG